MAKQTFTTGQVLTAAQMTQLQQTAMLGGDANARTASYVLVAGDAGNAITMSSTSATTITVNTGIFAAGDIVTIVNINSGVCTITAGTATVTTSGSLALSQNQGGVLRFTSASAAIFLQFATPATPATTSFVGASAYRSTTLSLTADTAVIVTYANESYDTDAFHSTSANTSRFTIPSGKNGKYLLIVNMFATGGSSRMIIYPYKNGANVGGSPNYSYVIDNRGYGNAGAMTGVWMMDLVATDYVEVALYSATNTATLQESTFQIIYLGA